MSIAADTSLECFSSAALLNTDMLCVDSESSFRYNDQWIGLKRGVDECTCDIGTHDDCNACRETWLWQDNQVMEYRYQDWRNNFTVDPGNSSCGRLNSLGWGDISCYYTLNYICKKYMGK